MDHNEVGIYLYQVASDVLDVGLYSSVDHRPVGDGVFGEAIEMFFMGDRFELVHELLVEGLVEVALEECDDAVDVGVLFFQLLVVAATLQ